MTSTTQTPSPRPIGGPPTAQQLEAADPTPAAGPARRSPTRKSPSIEARAVRAYLDALDKFSQTAELRDAELESPERRKKDLEAKAAEASSWQRLTIFSTVEEIEDRLGEHAKAKKAAERLVKLEQGFIEHAARYAQAAGIPPQRFARLGIEHRVLAAAGLA